MKCSDEYCLTMQQMLYNNLLQQDVLKKMLLKCFKCFQNSKNILAENTSHMVDLKFAKTLINSFFDEGKNINESVQDGKIYKQNMNVKQ